jgi:hypothetical protein
MTMTYQETVNRINSAAEAAAVNWFPRQCREPFKQMRLYYKPGHIAFWIGSEPLNDDWQETDLVISCAWTPATAKAQIVEKAHRLPILGGAQPY